MQLSFLMDTKTNYVTRLRRSKGVIGPEVLFKGSMLLKSKKDHFLANEKNEQKFINFLSEKLQSLDGVKKAKYCVTHVIGEGTDILVLLCHYADVDIFDLIFRSDKAVKTDTNKKSKE